MTLEMSVESLLSLFSVILIGILSIFAYSAKKSETGKLQKMLQYANSHVTCLFCTYRNKFLLNFFVDIYIASYSISVWNGSVVNVECYIYRYRYGRPF